MELESYVISNLYKEKTKHKMRIILMTNPPEWY